MPQEYIVRAFKAGDFKDNYGNTWCEVAFDGISEPVRWVVQDPSKVELGQVVYGHIEDATSKAGKPYNRFKTDKREEQASTPPARAVALNTEDSIARAVALKAAVEIVAASAPKDVGAVLEVADKFLIWLQGGSESSDPKESLAHSSSDPKKSAGSRTSEEHITTTNGNNDTKRDWVSVGKKNIAGLEGMPEGMLDKEKPDPQWDNLQPPEGLYD